MKASYVHNCTSRKTNYVPEAEGCLRGERPPNLPMSVPGIRNLIESYGAIMNCVVDQATRESVGGQFISYDGVN